MAREKAPLPNAAPADDKKRAIDTAMAQIERMYGKGSIMRFGDKAELNVDYIPTGSLSLDVALGIGGLPKGRIVEIYGPESSRTPASRRWRSPRPWSAPAPLTWWWWTPWRPWCPGRRSRAKWATVMWACRPG